MANKKWCDADFVYDKTHLGKGAFGTVFKAQHEPTKTDYAIKKIKKNEALQEVENMNIALGLKHEYIVSYHGYFIHDESICIVMDHYVFKNLREAVIIKQLELPDETIRGWIKQLMNVLLYMEINKVYHNDIKPDNILLNTTKNSIVLVDLGELQIKNEFKTLSIRGGTSAYMSLERAQGGESTTASEMWSCGLVIYEVIHFKLPLQNVNDGRIIYKETIFRPIMVSILEAKSDLERPHPDDVIRMLDPNRPKPRNQVDDKNDIPKSQIVDHLDIVNFEFLDDFLKSENILLISGEAGAGKTTLAQRYAMRFSEEMKDKDAVVVWIYSENKSTLMEMINTLALKVIKLKYENDKTELEKFSHKEKIKAITEYIQSRTNPHLFIFDNIEEDNMETIKLFVDSMNDISNLKIILTSRNAEINKNFNLKINRCSLRDFPIEIPKIKQYFYDKMTRENKYQKDIIDLVYTNISKMLEYLNPYFLNKALSTILDFGNFGIDTKDLPELIKEIENIQKSDYLFSNLSSKEECLRIMNILPFMNPDEISVTLLGKLVGDRKLTHQGIMTLEKYSIVMRIKDDAGYIKIHRLSMESLEEKMKRENNYSNCKSIIVERYHDIFNEAYVEIDDEYDDEKLGDALIHLGKICEERVTNLKEARLFERYIDYKIQNGRYIVDAILNRQKELCDSLEKITPPNSFEILYNLCKLFYMRSLRNISVELNEITKKEEKIASLISEEKVKDEGIKAYYFILYVYKMENFKKEEQNCFQSMVQILRRSTTTVSYRLRVQLAKFNGYISKEELLFLVQESLNYYTKYYQENQNDKKFANKIRWIADEIKDLDKNTAIQYYQLASEKYKNYYETNPNEKQFTDELRRIAGAMKDLDKNTAIQYYRLAFEIYRKNSNQNPNEKKIADELILIAIDIKDIDKNTAIQYYQLACEKYRNHIEKNPNDKRFTENLKWIASRIQNLDKNTAIQYYRLAFEIYKNYYETNPNHKEFAGNLREIAQGMKDLDKNTAIQYYRLSFEEYKNYYETNPNHKEFADNLREIADGLKYLDKNRAIQYYQLACEKYRNHIEENPYDKKFADGLKWFAYTIKDIDNNTAIQYFELLFNIYKNYYEINPNDKKFADNLREIAQGMKDLDKNTAIQYYQLACKIYKNYFEQNPNDKKFAENFKFFALGIENLDKNTAIQYYRLAFEIHKNYFNKNPLHKEFADGLKWFAYTIKDIDKNTAIQYFQLFLSIYKNYYEINPNDKKFADNLREIADKLRDLDKKTSIECYRLAFDKYNLYYTHLPDDFELGNYIFSIAYMLYKLDKYLSIEYFSLFEEKHRNFFKEVPNNFNFGCFSFSNAEIFKEFDQDIIIHIFNQSLDIYSHHYTRFPNIPESSEKVCKIGESLILIDKDLALKFYQLAYDMYQHFLNEHPNNVEPLENIIFVADELKGLDKKLSTKFYKLAFERCQKHLKEYPNDEAYVKKFNSITDVLNELCTDENKE